MLKQMETTGMERLKQILFDNSKTPALRLLEVAIAFGISESIESACKSLGLSRRTMFTFKKIYRTLQHDFDTAEFTDIPADIADDQKLTNPSLLDLATRFRTVQRIVRIAKGRPFSVWENMAIRDLKQGIAEETVLKRHGAALLTLEQIISKKKELTMTVDTDTRAGARGKEIIYIYNNNNEYIFLGPAFLKHSVGLDSDSGLGADQALMTADNLYYSTDPKNPQNQALTLVNSALKEVREKANITPGFICPRQYDASKKVLQREQLVWFLIFYGIYPKRTGITRASKAFKNADVDQDTFLKIIQAIIGQIHHRKAMQASGNWVPEWKFPATWLNGSCWLDELTPIEVPITKQQLKDAESNKKRALARAILSQKED